MRWLLLGGLCAPLIGCSEAETQAVEATVPVTVVTLDQNSPDLPGGLVGLATPFRQEQIGFEVGGRVDLVFDVGTEVQGARLGADREVLEQGDILARFDATRFEQQLEGAKLALASTQKELEAQQLEVETVSQSQLDEARAKQGVAEEDVSRAESQEQFSTTEKGRQMRLLAEGVTSQADFDKALRNQEAALASLQAARSSLVGAEAAVTQAEENIQLKRANIERTRALLAELQNQIDQAQTDLDDCILYAPYTGRITERHVGRGAFVQPGAGVVTLTMMDPIKVVVMSSAEKSRQLPPGTPVAVVPKDLSRFSSAEALYGTVTKKAEVADPATRTFQVEVVLRNHRRLPFIEGEGGVHGAAIDRVLPALARTSTDEGPLYVSPRCLFEEDGQVYVLRLPGVRLGQAESSKPGGLIQPEKVAIGLLDEFFTLHFAFQRVEDGSDLVAGDMLIADPIPEHLQGALMSDSDWAIRPGDIVPVSFEFGAAPVGFYVPVEAILTLNGAPSIYVVDEDDRARQVPVSLKETAGLLRRIEGDGLEPGTRVVVEGLHYVGEGDHLRVVRQIGG